MANISHGMDGLICNHNTGSLSKVKDYVHFSVVLLIPFLLTRLQGTSEIHFSDLPKSNWYNKVVH